LTGDVESGKPKSEGLELDQADDKWRDDALCKGAPPGMFYPITLRGKFVLFDERPAKAVCAACPVLAECFRSSIRNDEPCGIWGGVNEDERRFLMASRNDLTFLSDELLRETIIARTPGRPPRRPGRPGKEYINERELRAAAQRSLGGVAS